MEDIFSAIANFLARLLKDDPPKHQPDARAAAQPTDAQKIEEAIRALVGALNGLKEQYQADNQKRDTAEQKKKRWDRATTYGVWAYTILTIGIVGISAYQLKVSRDTFIFTNRPYIGIDKISLAYFPHDADGHPTSETHQMTWRIDIKNYGLLPGKEFRVTWHGYVNGTAAMRYGRPDSATIIFPSQIVWLEGGTGEPDYSAITKGTKVLELFVQVDYVGPMGHDRYCEKERYDPRTGGFFTLSAACDVH